MLKYNFRRYGLKRKILFSILSLVLVFSLVIPMGCLPKRDAATPTTDAERIAALESKVSQLQSKIASLPESNSTDYSGDINALYDEIDNLSMELDDILVSVDEMLATWEEEQESSNGSSSSGGEVVTTRWTPSIDFDNLTWADTEYTVSLDRHPTSIRDEDTYKLKVTVTNPVGGTATLALQPDVVLWVYFTPSSKDTSVDVNNTGLYYTGSDGLDSHGSIFWDAEYNPSNGVDCRRIEFMSEEFDVKALPDGNSFTISMDFDLYYVD